MLTKFDSWLLQEIRQLMDQRVNNFCDLVLRLPSVYPSDVMAVLKTLADEDPGDKRALSLAVSATDKAPTEIREPISTLRPPHPLDFEWRFSASATKEIAEKIKLLTPTDGKIALIATPSIAAQIDTLKIASECAYIGRDAEEVRILSGARGISRWIVADLGIESELGLRFDTVVMDPPWYDEYMLRFLWYSAQLCRTGGVTLISMPGVGTRPGIKKELNRYRRYWEELGFIAEAVESQRIPYVMPRFEKNSLNAVGIRNVSQTWRRGDLVRLRKLRATEVKWLGNLHFEPWEEFNFGKVRIRVNTQGQGGEGKPELISLLPHHVLPTVSRRDTRRAQARVWTSGNRVFGCDSPKLLATYLQKSSSNFSSKAWTDTPHKSPQLSINDYFDKQSLNTQIESLVNLELLEIFNEAQD